MKRMSLMALCVSLALAGSVRAQPVARQALDLNGLSCEDQFERIQTVPGHRGAVLVLVYGDRQSIDADKYLGEQLHVNFHPSARGQTPARARLAPVVPVSGAAPGTAAPDVHVVPVATLGGVPVVMRGILRLQFRNMSPDVPVWLDWRELLKQQFGILPGVPNLIVIDTVGRLRYTFGGAVDQEKFNQLTQAIEGLRREALAGGR